ncbi:MAG: response regulator [Chitinispirillaceae bacterium]|nr:response regulator [Chitinispirillaceae bacterium]
MGEMNNDGSIKRILVVDDNPDIHADFKRILLAHAHRKDDETRRLESELFGEREEEGAEGLGRLPVYSIDSAFQGEEAIVMIDAAERRGAPYALVYMDIRMPPGIDGLETIERIWVRHPHLEIVICTAYSDYSWEQLLRKLGPADRLLFIKKPFDWVMVKQLTLAVTRKWELGCANRDHLRNLESEVEKRTAELRLMMKRLEVLKEKAEAATRAKSEFLARMSHEIRTPMNAVIGFAGLLRQTALNDEQEEFVKAITESGNLLVALINDILDLSRIESSKVVIDNSAFDLEQIAGGVVTMLQDRVQSGAVTVGLDYQQDAHRTFRGDPVRIQQVLLNLAGNAIKFTERGQVTVRVEEVDEAEPGVALMRLSVKDTGIGIPAGKFGEIFEPFTQLDTSSRPGYAGSGLGLSITRSIVGLMNGSITFQSEVGKGSEFVVTLPLTRFIEPLTGFTPPAQVKTDPFQPPLDGVRVLVIEDNHFNQKLMTILLKKMGCEADLVSNGREAIEKLSSGGYAVILMDIQMPVMDGFEAARIITREMKLSTPIIALTARAFSADRKQCFDAGMVDFLVKPVDAVELRKRIEWWVKTGR